MLLHCSSRFVVFDVDATPSLPLFAAHVYYRALTSIPSLIRAWLDTCKDRNLHSAVTTYTAQHFSPVIISQELSQVRDPAVLKELSDDAFAAKVAGTANEVTATYTVDEKALELTLKLPMDWPLHGIEVRDHKRVGVAEDKWRAWILGVQKIIWSSVSCGPDRCLQGRAHRACLERDHRRWADTLQEECLVALRGHGGVCHLLFVRALPDSVRFCADARG
jgi:hypothetical protein